MTESAGERRHAVRNRLNKAMLAVQLLQAKISVGDLDDADSTLDMVLDSLRHLSDDLLPNAGSAPPPTGADQPASDPPRRALIVDDSPNEAELLSQYLQLNGFATHVVENGLEAITWLRQHDRTDVVLMDMDMPVMDGATAIQSIRQDHRLNEVRLFGVSGQEQVQAGVVTGSGGVEGWFTKPVDARQLVDHLSRPSR
jgi:CheY-like chemotaxis protein